MPATALRKLVVPLGTPVQMAPPGGGDVESLPPHDATTTDAKASRVAAAITRKFIPLFCLGLWLVCRLKFLLEQRRRCFVVTEFQTVRAATRGDGFEPHGELLQLG